MFNKHAQIELVVLVLVAVLAAGGLVYTLSSSESLSGNAILGPTPSRVSVPPSTIPSGIIGTPATPPPTASPSTCKTTCTRVCAAMGCRNICSTQCVPAPTAPPQVPSTSFNCNPANMSVSYYDPPSLCQICSITSNQTICSESVPFPLPKGQLIRQISNVEHYCYSAGICKICRRITTNVGYSTDCIPIPLPTPQSPPILNVTPPITGNITVPSQPKECTQLYQQYTQALTQYQGCMKG